MAADPAPRRRLFFCEQRRDRLLPRPAFYRRVAKNAAAALALVFVSLAIGIFGCCLTERLSWLDALLNASMILCGMGPLAEPRFPAGTLFASLPCAVQRHRVSIGRRDPLRPDPAPVPPQVAPGAGAGPAVIITGGKAAASKAFAGSLLGTMFATAPGE